MISDNMFQGVAVAKVLNGPRGAPTKDSHFKLEKESFPSNDTAAPVRNPSNNQDANIWKTQLMGTVGAYYQLGEDHATKDYYLAVKSSVPQIVQDLKSEIAEKKPTYRQLMTTLEWRDRLLYAENAARRNSGRLLVKAAESCKVNIERMGDYSAKTQSPNHAAPEMAVPTWQHETYGIHRVSSSYLGGGRSGSGEEGGRSGDAVAIYNGIVPPNKERHSRTFVANSVAGSFHVFPAMIAAPAPATSKKLAETKQVMRSAGWKSEDQPGLLVPIVIVENQ